jgi:teichuronic acid biosynthesis glycosyltransferase TuaH
VIAPTDPLGTVALLSADPWDDVWRRNQHLATQLVTLGLVQRIRYINPPSKLSHQRTFEPHPGIQVVTPHLLAPRHRGGLQLVAWEIQVRYLLSADVLWINDPVVGVQCLRETLPTLYDVTDDWRNARLSALDRVELVAAEDALARSTKTVVCSAVLRDRWCKRYGVSPAVVQNGVDAEAHRHATKQPLDGPRPHLMYVGTLHDDRLDIELLTELACCNAGSIHLVGPDHLSLEAREKLEATDRVRLYGAVRHSDVPNWMAAADVLLCPHRVTEFTLSLDAIKSFEYVASCRPVVATPTSGFQDMVGVEGIHIAEPVEFANVVAGAVRAPSLIGKVRGLDFDWSLRARDFARQLSLAEKPHA